MALIKVPDGGFYVDDSQVTVDYGKKSISIVGGGALSNIASIGASASAIAFENNMNMNSHKITDLADPTETTDAMTKNYADITYQTIIGMSEYVRTDDLADTATAGIVKQATAVADSSGATDTALEAKVNELLAALRVSGVLAPNA